MYELDQKYIEALEEIAGEIQESEDLEKYLDTEEEEDFLRLKEHFEPRIAAIYEEVAKDNPLQLLPFELVLLESIFEGLFLPKILGYTVLRGEIDDQYQYTRPQDHFKEILLAICQSPNFEILKKRIGQTIQVGFSLSSDIWITSLINGVDNKRIRYYLQSQKLDKFRRLTERSVGYERYKKQFRSEIFQTADFPTVPSELPILFNSLKHFLIFRVSKPLDNSSLIEPLNHFVLNEELKGTAEQLKVMMLYAMFYPITEKDQKSLAKAFNQIREKMPAFADRFLEFILELHQHPSLDITPDADRRMSAVVDKTYNDKLSDYYKLVDTIHDRGYVTDEVQEAVMIFHDKNEGLSVINECVRQTIYHYFARFIGNLEEKAYPDLFEISKLFPVYMRIFRNQHFNQGLKDLSMNLVNRLLVRYTDKRGKDYQDIKKFVSSVFVDYGFLKEKETIEMFKTRRKKKEE
jgi:hypothetical protein